MRQGMNESKDDRENKIETERILLLEGLTIYLQKKY